MDIDSRAELIKSLNAYEGAVLIISHDRNLLESVVDRLWLVNKGSVTSYDGSLEEYRIMQLEKDKTDKGSDEKSVNSRKQSRQDRAKALKSIAPFKKKADALEAKLDKAQIELALIDKALTVTDLFTKNPDEAVKLGQDRVCLEKMIEGLEADWLTALEAYERERDAADL
ncbi:hypothetical protein AB8615_02755 [Litorimonas sp. RW-G-Af-16]|uniref:hypothetical protein n=1 Tax=Litorimonas sp. RW-G-Af-16 TaxID=3241168 RepID=UPI003AB0E457